MKRTAAEPYRDIDFTHARRGPVVPPEPGKTKISIRLDNAVLDYFRAQVEKAGGGNYQTLINDALVAYLHQCSLLDAVREVVREELGPSAQGRRLTPIRPTVSSGRTDAARRWRGRPKTKRETS
jgi:uncharacterized protein (DUF4415 family)